MFSGKGRISTFAVFDASSGQLVQWVRGFFILLPCAALCVNADVSALGIVAFKSFLGKPRISPMAVFHASLGRIACEIGCVCIWEHSPCCFEFPMVSPNFISSSYLCLYRLLCFAVEFWRFVGFHCFSTLLFRQVRSIPFPWHFIKIHALVIVVSRSLCSFESFLVRAKFLK